MRRRKYRKGILCVESNWDGFVTEPKSGMKSFMDYITTNQGISQSYNFINTPVELEYVLKNVNPSKFSFLYMGFHGRPNAIKLGLNKEFVVTLDELSEMMGSRFSGYGIHFASCSSLYIEDEQLRNFKQKTGVSFITGYTTDVDWDESSLMDLAFINRWIYSKNYKTMFDNLLRDYKSLVNLNGFVWYI